MIQDQALVASKHFLVETENENLVDNAEGPQAKLKSLPDQTDGSDYWFSGVEEYLKLWGRGWVDKSIKFIIGTAMKFIYFI